MTAEFPLAVHALVYLLHKETVVSSQELADNICTNPARVRKVMTRLHQAGFIEATRGKGSGYRYQTTPKLSLDKVLIALNEEPISMNWRSGDMDKECLVSSGMGQVMDQIYTEMNEECRHQLRHITIESINRQLFGEKE